MCGILAAYSKSGALPDRERFAEAVALQSHRGPDHRKILQTGKCLFGFNRLSIIDLSASANQPIQHGPVTLAMNGEIYNYVELRDDLISEGAAFQSQGDAEVMAAALHNWGVEKTMSRLRGMWAAAAWDESRQRLIVSRDRLGIKPLWIHKRGDLSVVSSEIKSIHHLFPETKALNHQTIGWFLKYGIFERGHQSFYESIQAFPNGHFLELGDCAALNQDGGFAPKSFWSLDIAQSQPADYERLETVLHETVNIHLRSDVPVGVALSGGLDSTILAGYSRDFAGLKCYSIQHPVSDVEKPLIDETVQRWGLNHAYLPCGEIESLETIDFLLKQLDQPFKATQTLYQYSIRKAAAEDGCKVMLTGDGADEVFGGYTKCVPPYLQGLMRRGSWMRALRDSSALAHFCGDAAHKLFLRNAKAAMLNRPVSLIESNGALLHPDFQNQAPDLYLDQIALRESSLKHYLNDRLFHEPLPYWLRVEDGISMSVSLETRVPYLDHVLIEEVFKTRDVDFLKDGRNKSLLRIAAKENIPEHILAPKKKYQRPGSNDRLVFDVLKDAVLETLAEDRAKGRWLNADRAEKTFLHDAEQRRNAPFWFRAFLALRWHGVIG